MDINYEIWISWYLGKRVRYIGGARTSVSTVQESWAGGTCPQGFFKIFSYSNVVVLDGSISRLFASSSPLWSSSSSQSSCTTTGSTGIQQKHLPRPHDIFKIRHRGKLPWIVYRMPWTQNTHKLLAHSNRDRVLLGKVKVEKKCNFETIVTWSKKLSRCSQCKYSRIQSIDW